MWYELQLSNESVAVIVLPEMSAVMFRSSHLLYAHIFEKPFRFVGLAWCLDLDLSVCVIYWYYLWKPLILRLFMH